MELSTLFLTILTAGVCLYYYVLSKYKLSYFGQLKVPYVRPIPFLGNLAPYIFRREAYVDIVRRIYRQFPEAKYVGFYQATRPVFLIRDPELINTIAIKNFDNFCDHRNFVDDNEPMASKNLFGLKGDHWREMRRFLSPVFTSSKMKMMFGLICECADNLTNFLAQSGEIGRTYEMKETLSRYTTDVVATCAFGINVNSFKNLNNEFFLLGREAFTFDGRLSILFFIHSHFPFLTRLFKLRMFSEKVETFFKDIVNSTVKIRQEQGIVRPDLIQMMMENSKNNDKRLKFDIEEMTAQAFVFFFGGFDTVSTAMSFLVYQVATNPDVYNKLRKEMDRVLQETNGKPTYETVSTLKYFDAVLNESLRLYPIVSFLDRICVKEFELPPATSNSNPITLKPGDTVWFSPYSLHRDPKYYPQPEKFNPDRFLNGEVDNSVYIPFGVGPRICIGYRFALLQMKIMLFYLLWRCDVEPDPNKTRDTIILSKKSQMTMAQGGIWLKVKARKLEHPVKQSLSNGIEKKD